MRTEWIVAGAALALVVAACGGDATGPESELPPLGTYAYRFEGVQPGAARTYVGTFTLTYAAPDSIAGTFNVPGLDAVARLGFRNGDAWVVYGMGGAYIHIHRLDWTGSRWTCEGRYLNPVGSSPPTACSLTR